MIVMWHGSKRWDGAPEIKPSRKGRAELGPGIYLTTRYQTAREYAKGGGVVRRITLQPRLILEQASLSLCDACDFATSVISRAQQKDVIETMLDCAERNKHEGRVLLGGDQQHLHAEVLVNLCVNGDLATGKKGQALAEFLSSQGIDCSFSHRTGREHWGVIFNPFAVTDYRKMLAKEVSIDLYELPSPQAQIEDPHLLTRIIDGIKNKPSL